jgi:hypothetical protein
VGNFVRIVPLPALVQSVVKNADFRAFLLLRIYSQNIAIAEMIKSCYELRQHL